MTEPQAAVAILHAKLPEESILLMRRTERPEDSWSGHWSFPGGRREVEDPSLLHTALRELEEECGIRLAPEQMQAELPHVLARRRVRPYVLVAPFVFGTAEQLPTRLDVREAVESRWVTLRELRDPSLHALRPVPGRPAEILFPGIAMGGTPLWGFTYRLITDWLQLLEESERAEQAGFAAACVVLERLLSRGLAVQDPWSDNKHVCVRGVIPVAEILAEFSTAERFLPAVNCLEIGEDRIRIIGPNFEEYLIVTS